ncbi:MAG: sigma-70 family RNA polymerase sigma factor [Hydrococcus sp. RM1_1_31]|nr:sigma-70 family RNA polymerase sigma factor [Hydrococcus sp. RM1_1_31]
MNLKTELRKKGQTPSQQKWASAANLEPSELSQIIALGKERWATIASMNVRELEKCLAVGRKAKRQLIEANLRLVVAIAKKYHRKPMDLLDLIQEGNLALSKAIEKFDPTLGYKLSTFAYWQIRKAITGAIPDLWPGACRFPNSVLQNLRQLPQIQQQLRQEKGRAPTYDELADALRIAPVKLQILLEHWTKVSVSLSYVPKNLSEGTLEDVIPDLQGLKEFETRLVEEEVKRLMLTLNEREAAVVRLRYGLNENQKSHSQAKVEKILQLTSYQVRSLERSALKKMRSEEQVSASQLHEKESKGTSPEKNLLGSHLTSLSQRQSQEKFSFDDESKPNRGTQLSLFEIGNL